MKRTIYLVLVAILVVGVVVNLGWAAKGGKGPKSQSGVVVTTVDGSDKGKPVPIPGARVNLFLANGSFVASTETDANAEAKFDNLLPTTTYVLVGYAPDGRITGAGFTTNSGGSAKAVALTFYGAAP